MIWVVTVVHAGELVLVEAYNEEEEANKRAEELTKNYTFVSVDECEILT